MAQHLDGDLLPELDMARLDDDAHAALRDLALDPVTTRDHIALGERRNVGSAGVFARLPQCRFLGHETPPRYEPF